MTTPTQRIEFIDAMRGFTMILVVMTHIGGFCLGIENDIPSVHPFLYEFRMPTFFFISGFVLYKVGHIWNVKNVFLFLKRKFPVQIITTIIFFTIYLYVNGIPLETGILSDSKLGYWFTYALFIYFVVYSISQYLFQLFHFSDIVKDIATISLGSVFYLLFSVDSIFESLPINRNIKDILSMQHWGFFFFFSIGTLFKKYYNIIQQYLDKKPIIFICLLIYFILNLFYDKMKSTHISIFYLLTGISGVILVFSFFRKNQHIFSKNEFIGYCLQHIGRRTLDIYLLHYFLLPTNLYTYTSFLREAPVPVIEFVITLIVSLIVICFCLIISSILRMSPSAAYWLFGAKKQIPYENQQ